MIKTFTANKERLKLFFYTMYERQLIWYRRFILKLPQEEWTKDELYKRYRFTNVYRELDRASQWSLNNIVLNKDCWCKYKSDEDNYLNLIWKVLFFRATNNPRLFNSTDVIDDYKSYNPDKFYKYLKETVIDKNLPIGHGAYQQLIRHEVTLKSGEVLTFDNFGEYLAKGIIVMLHQYLPEFYSWMQNSFTSNKTADEFIDYMSTPIFGCGRFVAHEFYQDLCYIKKYTGIELMKWDADSATNAGPGSTLGSKFIFEDVKNKKDVIEIIKYLQSISEEQLKEIQKELYPDTDGFYYIEWDKDQQQYVHSGFNFSLNQIEMWLCEYAKYVRYASAEDVTKVKTRRYTDFKSKDELMY